MQKQLKSQGNSSILRSQQRHVRWSDSGTGNVLTVMLNEADVLRLEMIELDRDEQDALAFIREKLLPEIKRQKGMKMHGHLDGGKGSAF